MPERWSARRNIVVALLGFAFLAGVGLTDSSAQNVLRVPETFSTIQSAIDAAHDGDVVSVGPGVY